MGRPSARNPSGPRSLAGLKRQRATIAQIAADDAYIAAYGNALREHFSKPRR